MAPNYIGDDAFNRIIDQIDIGLDVYSVKAFVAGYVWGLELVQPSHLFSELLLHGTEDEIVMENEEQAMKFYGNLMGLWNEFSSLNKKVVCSFRSFPSTSGHTVELGDFLWRFNADLNLFLGGLAETGSYGSNDETLTSDISETEEIAKMVEFLAEDYDSTIDQEKQYVKTLKEAGKLYQRWKTLFPLMGASLTSYRKKRLSARANRQEPKKIPKIGRNAPCYCGSGKKHKKCCMLKVVH